VTKNLGLTAFRAVWGSVFVFSGGIKLLAPPEEFLATIYRFELVHGQAAQVLSIGLPWAEFIFGVFLILGLWSEISLAFLWALNSVFIAALASVLIRKVPMGDCGCMGKNISLPVSSTLLLDLALWMGFFLLFRLKKRQKSWSLDQRFSK